MADALFLDRDQLRIVLYLLILVDMLLLHLFRITGSDDILESYLWFDDFFEDA